MVSSDRNLVHGDANSSLVNRLFSLFRNADSTLLEAAESISKYKGFVIVPAEVGGRKDVYIFHSKYDYLADPTTNAIARINVQRGKYDSVVTLLYNFTNKEQLEKASRFRREVLLPEKIDHNFDTNDYYSEDVAAAAA